MKHPIWNAFLNRFLAFLDMASTIKMDDGSYGTVTNFHSGSIVIVEVTYHSEKKVSEPSDECQISLINGSTNSHFL